MGRNRMILRGRGSGWNFALVMGTLMIAKAIMIVNTWYSDASVEHFLLELSGARRLAIWNYP